MVRISEIGCEQYAAVLKIDSQSGMLHFLCFVSNKNLKGFTSTLIKRPPKPLR